jgi:eukaryotic-like serine/threonine-protein kinase
LSLQPQTGSALSRLSSPAGPYRFGKYTLLAKLAQGGMGEIFAALLTGAAGFEKLVVIKRILPHLAEDPRFVQMFLTEARVTASLTHPNICQVFELGQIDGEYYLAMEYLEGVSLSRLIRQNVNRGLDLRVATAILCQTLEGLQFAHCFRQPGRGMVGIIHRDMSPSNVFVTSAGLVKVLDFGVAKVSHHSITTATGLKGKYPYMSPEQIRGQEVDGRADLFSVGVLLYEAVTGTSLFQRASDFDTLFAVVEGARPQPSQERPDIPLGLEEVIDRSLRVAREERYASAREMGEALARSMAPVGGLASSRELGELVRTHCADDLEEERDRIHHATAYLTALTDQGRELPDFLNRRPRPVVTFEPVEPAANPSAADTVRTTPAVAELLARPMDVSMSTDAEVAVLRARSGSRRNMVAILLIAAALAAGAGGWWLRGSAEERPATATASAGLTPSSGSATDPVPVSDPVPDPLPASDPVPAPTTPAARPPILAEPLPPSRPVRPRKVASRRSERSTSAARDPGYFSIDALPYASIYIDGELAGITPLIRFPLRPGKHSVRAVTEGGTENRFTISVRSGDTISRRLNLELLRP